MQSGENLEESLELVFFSSETRVPQAAASCEGVNKLIESLLIARASQSSFTPRTATAVLPNGSNDVVSASRAPAVCKISTTCLPSPKNDSNFLKDIRLDFKVSVLSNKYMNPEIPPNCLKT